MGRELLEGLLGARVALRGRQRERLGLQLPGRRMDGNRHRIEPVHGGLCLRDSRPRNRTAPGPSVRARRRGTGGLFGILGTDRGESGRLPVPRSVVPTDALEPFQAVRKPKQASFTMHTVVAYGPAPPEAESVAVMFSGDVPEAGDTPNVSCIEVEFPPPMDGNTVTSVSPAISSPLAGS